MTVNNEIFGLNSRLLSHDDSETGNISKESMTCLFKDESEKETERENGRVSEEEVQLAFNRCQIFKTCVSSILYGVIDAERNEDKKIEQNTWVGRFYLFCLLCCVVYSIACDVNYAKHNEVTVAYYIIISVLIPSDYLAKFMYTHYTNGFGEELYNSGHIEKVKASIKAHMYMPNQEKLFLLQLSTYVNLFTSFAIVASFVGCWVILLSNYTIIAIIATFLLATYNSIVLSRVIHLSCTWSWLIWCRHRLTTFTVMSMKKYNEGKEKQEHTLGQTVRNHIDDFESLNKFWCNE